MATENVDTEHTGRRWVTPRTVGLIVVLFLLRAPAVIKATPGTLAGLFGWLIAAAVLIFALKALWFGLLRV